MLRAFLWLAAASVLTSCAGPSHSVGIPPTVSYRFSGDDISAADARADRYCHQFGKRARLDAVTRADEENAASYRCR
jgi:hypothetical protein